jgi:hypothetical protein
LRARRDELHQVGHGHRVEGTNVTGPTTRAVRLQAVAAFAFLTVALLRLLGDYDVFFHMVVGGEVLDRRGIPGEEFYILPRLGEPSHHYEWGFGLLYHLVHSAAGVPGMVLTNALLGALTLFISIRAAQRLAPECPPLLPFLVACGAYFCFDFRWVYRPETVLATLVVIEIGLLEGITRTGRLSRLIVLPALVFVLVQLHPSAIFLLGVFAMYAIQWIFAGVADVPRRKLLVASLGTGAAMLLLGALNPYGLQQILLPFSFAGCEELLDTLVEFLPVLKTEYRYHFLLVALFSVISLTIARPVRIVDLLLFAAFGFLAFRYARNLGLFAIVMIVPVTRGVQRIWTILMERAPATGPWRSRSAKGVWVAAALAAASMIYAPVSDGRWGIGVKPETFPERSMALIMSERPPGNILNFFHLGSYVAWSSNGAYLAFVDGRNYCMNRALALHDRVFGLQRDWFNVLGNYSITMVLTPATLIVSGTLIPLVERFAVDASWVLVEVEPAAMLFVRRDVWPSLDGATARDKREIWRQVLREEELTLADYPNAAGAHLAVGKAHDRLGQGDLAADSYRRYLQHRPDDRAVRQRLEVLDRTAGEPGGGR